jgi:hypothetical protein
MGDGFNRREPIEPSKIYDNPEIVEIFQRSHWMGYFERLRGFDDEISLEFALNFQNIKDLEYITVVRGLEIKVDEASISRVSNLPMGLPWDKEERQEATNAKKLFFHKNERPKKTKMG